MWCACVRISIREHGSRTITERSAGAGLRKHIAAEVQPARCCREAARSHLSAEPFEDGRI
jgi:hypothetical protein